MHFIVRGALSTFRRTLFPIRWELKILFVLLTVQVSIGACAIECTTLFLYVDHGHQFFAPYQNRFPIICWDKMPDCELPGPD